MLARQSKKKILTSLVDILVNNQSGSLNKSPDSKYGEYLELCESVRREVENLLNSHAPFLSFASHLSELHCSVLNYGIPDFTTHSFSSEQKQLQLCKIIEEKIRTFEPRFKTVNVFLKQRDAVKDRTVRFRIEGTIYAEPAPELIVLDSHLQTESGAFVVFYDD